ncbi:angiomotin-like [Schistocerca americana]|uniref:angiomotin-like n=1 Tax=Schistocerca americana TaxID=7009 RepID=UPI001F4F71E4|nr:angiomotin-like [Schistocerca americana]
MTARGSSHRRWAQQENERGGRSDCRAAPAVLVAAGASGQLTAVPAARPVSCAGNCQARAAIGRSRACAVRCGPAACEIDWAALALALTLRLRDRFAKFGPRWVPAAPSDFAAAPRAAAAAVAATTPTARPVDASRAASSGSAPGGRSGACGPSSVATAFGADGRDPSAGPPSQAVAVQPVLQPLSLGTPKESDTAAPCPAPTQQPSTQRQETLPLFVGPDAPSRPVPEAAPVVTGSELQAEAKGAWLEHWVERPRLEPSPSHTRRSARHAAPCISRSPAGNVCSYVIDQRLSAGSDVNANRVSRLAAAQGGRRLRCGRRCLVCGGECLLATVAFTLEATSRVQSERRRVAAAESTAAARARGSATTSLVLAHCMYRFGPRMDA